jgi:tripartite-type tricarboxylate transporter receptor subunit TctC
MHIAIAASAYVLGTTASALLVAIFFITSVAQAQTCPIRPIRIVIPYSAGAATDIPARLIWAKLSDVFGRQIIVDNRPGAGSAIGSEIVARAICRH